MPATPKHASSERERTDRSLSSERRKTDDELATRRADLEDEADAVVTAARRRADEVLRVARETADEKLEQAGADAGELGRVDEARRREDEVLGEERASADDRLSDERQAAGRALTALLIAERTRTDEDLLLERGRMDQMLGSRDDFLAVVSHDLRNALGGIVMGAGALLRLEADPIVKEAIGREARRIQRFTVRMGRLVSALLDIASIEAGHFAVAPERHDVRELLRETLDVFQPLADDKKVTITCDARGGSPMASYDHERILQVLANLVGNAIKFTPEGGKIDLIAETASDDVLFTVKDSGSGIEGDKLKSIFEQFWQAAEKRSSGLGLGLHISRGIVEAHGGRIWAQSQPGVGSAFFFTLPVVSASVREHAARRLPSDRHA